MLKTNRGFVVLLIIYSVVRASDPVIAQTKGDSNKEMSELILKSAARLVNAYVISNEMGKDPACRGYKDIPTITVDGWISAIGAPKDEQETLKAISKELLDNLASQKTKDGKGMTEEKIYLPLKEAWVKHLNSQGSNDPTAICDRLATASRNQHSSSVSMMKAALAIEKSDKSKK